MLYSVIKRKGGDEFVRVGIVAKNDNNEIMLVDENIDRINQQVINIPYVDVIEFKEENIISEFNNKYGIKINNLESYINETSFLDEMCNERLQVNMFCKLENNNIEGTKWCAPENAFNSPNITSYAKECIEVYNYNITTESSNVDKT